METGTYTTGSLGRFHEIFELVCGIGSPSAWVRISLDPDSKNFVKHFLVINCCIF
jgi:hypothetical protein